MNISPTNLTNKSKPLSPPGLWIWYTVEEQHLWSQSLYDMMDVEPKIRPSFQLWLELIYADDLVPFLSHIDNLLNGQMKCEFRFRICDQDKVERNFHCFAEVLVSDSPKIYYIAFQITELASEAGK